MKVFVHISMLMGLTSLFITSAPLYADTIAEPTWNLSKIAVDSQLSSAEVPLLKMEDDEEAAPVAVAVAQPVVIKPATEVAKELLKAPMPVMVVAKPAVPTTRAVASVPAVAPVAPAKPDAATIAASPKSLQAFMRANQTPKYIRIDLDGYNLRSSPQFVTGGPNILPQKTKRGDAYAVSRMIPFGTDGVAFGIFVGNKEQWVYVPHNRSSSFQFCESKDCFSVIGQAMNALSDINSGKQNVAAQCGVAEAINVTMPHKIEDIKAVPPPVAPPRVIAAEPSVSTSGSLWDRYQAFARNFYKKNGRKVNGWNAGVMKRQYLRELIDTFGQEDASVMLEAVAAWGEAPNRGTKPPHATMAEMAAVMKVMDNRAENKYPGDAPDLTNIGIKKADQNQLMRVLLSKWQFSVFNDSDPGLVRILTFNPDQPSIDKDVMRVAFETREKLNKGEIQYMGAMAGKFIQNYHANYVSPGWGLTPLQNPTVRVMAEGKTVDVNLNSPRYNVTHIFYGAR